MIRLPAALLTAALCLAMLGCSNPKAEFEAFCPVWKKVTSDKLIAPEKVQVTASKAWEEAGASEASFKIMEKAFVAWNSDPKRSWDAFDAALKAEGVALNCPEFKAWHIKHTPKPAAKVN